MPLIKRGVGEIVNVLKDGDAEVDEDKTRTALIDAKKGDQKITDAEQHTAQESSEK